MAISKHPVLVGHFAKATSLMPTEYIQQARVAKARGILELTNRPLDQVAWEVGYKDPSAFSKIFQQLLEYQPQSIGNSLVPHQLNISREQGESSHLRSRSKLTLCPRLNRWNRLRRKYGLHVVAQRGGQ
jgi:AraC-like DNA-binding protein